MQDKLKYILFGAGGLIILVILIVLGARIKSLENAKNALTSENAALNQKVTQVSGENKELKNKITGLNDDLAKLKEEKDQVQQKFDAAAGERDQLQAKIDQLIADKEKLNEAVATAQQAQQVEPVSPDAYWGKVLKKKADLELQVDALRDQLKAMKVQSDQLVLEKNSLTMELSNIKRDGTDLQRSADYNQRLTDTLTQELAREKSDKMEIEKTLSTLKADNRILRQQLQNAINQKVKLEQQMSDLLQKNATLEDSMANMEVYVKQQMVQVDSLKNRIQESKQAPSVAQPKEVPFEDVNSTAPRSPQSASGQAIQLAPIVVRPQGESSASPAGRSAATGVSFASTPQINGRGRVVSVDRENNFAVIDMGKNAGLKIGDAFRVVRAGQTIANLSVIQVRDKIAACDILKEIATIMPGDQVL